MWLLAFHVELHPSIVANARDAEADMMALNLARTMTPVALDLAYMGKQGYTLSDFFAGK